MRRPLVIVLLLFSLSANADLVAVCTDNSVNQGAAFSSCPSNAVVWMDSSQIDTWGGQGVSAQDLDQILPAVVVLFLVAFAFRYVRKFVNR